MTFGIFHFCKKSSRNAFQCVRYMQKLVNNAECLYRIDDKLDDSNKEYNQLANKYLNFQEQTCLLIHPFVKWGPRKVKETSPQNQAAEAAALINTLTGWKMVSQVIVPLESLDKKTLFGSGNLEKLKRQVRQDGRVTAVFINVGVLKHKQIIELEMTFGVMVLDRYRVVMQILRQHATSKQARLQVALAEIPYLRSRLDKWESRDRMLLDREQKLRAAIQKVRIQRELLRTKRTALGYPVVAVVGYTNAGKTSLIKALTGDERLQPKDQLFATLDVTVHSGLLPSMLRVLYVDTVGFISNIPTGLIECFVATLEDAMLADVIVHVQDVSSDDCVYQRKHVQATLKSLSEQAAVDTHMLIQVGNKADVATAAHISRSENKHLILVSAKQLTGLDILRQKIESAVLKTTGRTHLTIRVPVGGDETRWLYRNATVVGQEEDVEDSQFQYIKVIITKIKIQQFYHYFIESK